MFDTGATCYIKYEQGEHRALCRAGVGGGWVRLLWGVGGRASVQRSPGLTSAHPPFVPSLLFLHASASSPASRPESVFVISANNGTVRHPTQKDIALFKCVWVCVCVFVCIGPETVAGGVGLEANKNSTHPLLASTLVAIPHTLLLNPPRASGVVIQEAFICRHKTLGQLLEITGMAK